jgi:hypothetical protein
MAKFSHSHARKTQIEQIQTKLKTLSIVNQYAFLIKDSGEVLSGDDRQCKEIFDYIDVSKQLIDEVSMMIGVFDTISDAVARGAGAGGLQ